MVSAARDGDSYLVSQYVGFPRVRENVRGQIKAMLLETVSADPTMRGNPFAGLGAMLGSAMVDQVLESTVTLEFIARQPQIEREVEMSEDRVQRGLVVAAG